MWSAEVPAKQRDDSLGVAVEHSEPLARPPHREPLASVGVTLLDRTPVGGEAVLAERRAVADGIDLEEVLVVAAEAHHPLGERQRVGDPRGAYLCVQIEQLAGEIADRPVRVIGVHDHLHDVPGCSLDEGDQLS
jgi:hypothetical protein